MTYVLVATGTTGCSRQPPVCPVDGAPLRGVESGFVGVCAKEFVPGNSDQPDFRRLASLLDDAGIRWVGSKLHWAFVEPEAGQYRWELYDDRLRALSSGGLEPIVVVRDTPVWASSRPDAEHPGRYPPADLERWQDMLRKVVARYSRYVSHWEIWNEPDDRHYWLGTEEEYLGLLDAAYRAIKEVDPKAIVIAPSIVFHPWEKRQMAFLERVVAEGRYDAVSVHLYYRDVEAMYRKTVEVRQLLAAHGRGEVPLFITEVNLVDIIVDCEGYLRRTDEQKMQDVRDFYSCLGNAGADAVLWYKASDTGAWCGEERHGNGLLDEALAPKPAFHALEEVADSLTGVSRSD